MELKVVGAQRGSKVGCLLRFFIFQLKPILCIQSNTQHGLITSSEADVIAAPPPEQKLAN
jgi:hypothetical protein